MFPFAAIALVAVSQAPDQLEELVRRSAEIPHFQAIFELSSTTSAATSEIRIDCGGPTRVRVDRGAEGKRTSMWSVDGTLAIVSNEGGRPMHGRVDAHELYAVFDAVEAQLVRDFPGAKPRGELRSAVSMRWYFDEKAAKSNFAVETTITTGSPTPMGWLDTLVQKAATPVEEGELLKFSTDGHFDLSVSRLTGMLQEFRGRSPKGEMRVLLKSTEFASAPPAQRFEIEPAPQGGEDVSSELRRTIARVAELQLRRRMYDVLAAAKGPLDGPESAHGLATLKVRSLCRRLHEVTLTPVVEQARESIAKARGLALEHLKKLRNEGVTPEELSTWSARQLTLFEEQLAILDSSIPARTQPPPGAQELPNARKLSAIEATVLRELWRDTGVEPLMAECRRAFDEASR